MNEPKPPTLIEGPPPAPAPRERTGATIEQQPAALAQTAAPPSTTTLLEGPPPPAPPRERTGATVESSSAPTAAPVPPTLLEGPAPPAPPRERTGAMLEPEPSSPAATASAAPPFARVLGLPARPRLRIVFGWKADELVCEATLLDERRQLVHRARFLVSPTVQRVFSWFASELVKHAHQSGAVVMAPHTRQPEATSMELDDEPEAEPTSE